METLARRVAKTALFAALATLSFFFVHTYPQPMTQEQVAMWWTLSDWLGIDNPEHLIAPVMLSLKVVVAAIAYRLVMRLLRAFATRYIHKNSQDNNHPPNRI